MTVFDEPTLRRMYIDEGLTIRQIARACNMTDTEIRRVVHALREAGLIELVKPPNAAKPVKKVLRRLVPQLR